MNHLKTVSDEAMSLLRAIIKLNVADVKEIFYEVKRGVTVEKAAILIEYIQNVQAPKYPIHMYTPIWLSLRFVFYFKSTSVHI